eukprot:349588-Chlamydomonas_euryale.AAC.2
MPTHPCIFHPCASPCTCVPMRQPVHLCGHASMRHPMHLPRCTILVPNMETLHADTDWAPGMSCSSASSVTWCCMLHVACWRRHATPCVCCMQRVCVTSPCTYAHRQAHALCGSCAPMHRVAAVSHCIVRQLCANALCGSCKPMQCATSDRACRMHHVAGRYAVIRG